jgi:hypothetical protein
MVVENNFIVMIAQIREKITQIGFLLKRIP